MYSHINNVLFLVVVGVPNTSFFLIYFSILKIFYNRHYFVIRKELVLK